MKYFILFLLLTCSASASLVDRYKAYVIQSGQDPNLVNRRGSPITVFTKPDGSLDWLVWRDNVVGFLPPQEDQLPSVEQAAVVLENYAAQKESQRQASKPLEQRTYENQFYALTEQLFNLTGVTNEITPKLGFPELQAKIEQIQATDPMTAVNLSLKLLSIDAALKRYSVLWWDDAIQHDLGE